MGVSILYTFLIGEDNTLTATVVERIMERSKLVDSLHFLADPIYKDIDMSDFTVMMEYVLPVSKKYKTEILEKSDELYKDMLEYKLPFDTALTSEPGDIEIQLTFTNVTLDADGKSTQYVRKVGPGSIKIVSISTWSDIIPDEALSAVDQRLLAAQALMKALNEQNNTIMKSKADSLRYKDNLLQLTAQGTPIGTAVKIVSSDSGSTDPEDGTIRVVEF